MKYEYCTTIGTVGLFACDFTADREQKETRLIIKIVKNFASIDRISRVSELID